MVRLYFNRRSEQPWSIDTGPGTAEATYDKVLIEAPGKTVFSPDAGDNQNTPTAWIEFMYGKVVQRNGTALICPL